MKRLMTTALVLSMLGGAAKPVRPA